MRRVWAYLKWLLKINDLSIYGKEENKVENVINIIKNMGIKYKLRLGICLTTSDGTNILYNKTEMYEKFDTVLKK